MIVIRLLEHLRRSTFWIMDFLKGSPIRRHYKEVKHILENPNTKSAISKRGKHLKKLLEHATSLTSFYEDYKGFENLQDFPVVTKSLVQENIERFNSRPLKPYKAIKVSTSGSTGIPFVVFQDKNKKNRNTADVICFSEQIGFNIGYKVVYLKFWDKINRKNPLTTFIQNIMVHNVMDVGKTQIASLLTKLKKDKSTKVIIGYPSFLEQLCKHVDSENLPSEGQNVKCILSMAEKLNDYERHGMSSYFQAPIYERYSNMENGIIAQQTADSNEKYKPNWASYYIEILEEDSDKHVEPGIPGRLVITDLFNYSMPMIRYDTGDMAVYEITKDGTLILNKIYGRKTDMIYNTAGQIISPHIFYRIFIFSECKQFQFIQHGEKQYTFKLNAKQEDTQEQGLIDNYKKYLGDDAIFSFEYVDEIPLLSSGKRKKVLNTYR